MRWKFLVLVSLVAAILGFGLWCALTIALFGSATELARHDWIFLSAYFLPSGFGIFAGFFVYRHTSRRRKTQAIVSAILALLLIALAYAIALRISPKRFRISRPNKIALRLTPLPRAVPGQSLSARA